MAKDMDITAVAIGPVVIGQVTERRDPEPRDRWRSLIVWLLTVAFIASASPVVGFILILGTAIALAAITAPDSITGERTPE